MRPIEKSGGLIGNRTRDLSACTVVTKPTYRVPSYLHVRIIIWRVGWYTRLIRRVLVLMIGFISSWVTQSLLITFKYMPYSAISDLHHLQTTVAHALWFSLSTSRLLATDLNTELPQSHTPSITHKSSLHRSTLHNSRRELTENYSRATSKRASVSPINPWSDTRETLLPTVLLLLRHCWNAWGHCWCGHVTPPYSCIIQVFGCYLATRDEAMRGEARDDSSRHGRARLGTEKTPLRLLLRNCGNVFRCYNSCIA
jgi:hypothetical protein